jgi:hypothetical protein
MIKMKYLLPGNQMFSMITSEPLSAQFSNVPLMICSPGFIPLIAKTCVKYMVPGRPKADVTTKNKDQQHLK